jgi:uncharacterized protein YfkK (UPF0435 family)
MIDQEREKLATLNEIMNKKARDRTAGDLAMIYKLVKDNSFFKKDEIQNRLPELCKYLGII